MLNRATLLLAAALVAAVLSASPAPAASGFPVTIHAANGDVRIESRPVRIVSLSPTATEDLFAVGAGSQVVAVDDQSSYPAVAPRTKLSGFTPNAEAIAGYHPDLVVVSNDGGIVGALQKLGITVLLEPAAANLPQAYDEIRQLGAATGRTTEAARVVRSMQTTITRLVRSVPKKSRHLKVFHELGPDYYSATSSTFIGAIYRIFGFANIADAVDDAHTGYPQLCGQSAKTVAARPGWRNVPAVTHRRVVGVDDDIASRWGPRIVQFVRLVAEAARRA